MAKKYCKKSVFNYSYSKRYYLTHPWKLIKEFFQNCYHGWRRAIYGWTWEDCWNFDSWFCTVIPQLLKHLADYGCGYPGEPFETPEKWHDWLHKMANTIERLQYDDWMEDSNEYSKDYEKTFEDDLYKEEHPNGPFLTTTTSYGSSTKEEIREQYYKRCEEIHKTRGQVLEDFGKEFFKHFDCLWD